jgi:hypothetical protein
MDRKLMRLSLVGIFVRVALAPKECYETPRAVLSVTAIRERWSESKSCKNASVVVLAG